MEQKHFMDIERIKYSDELKNGNVDGFEVGDIIQITEKVDGSNASICYDSETGKLVAFSRKQELSYNNTLNGFWNWVQSLDETMFTKYPNYVFFGEWLTAHKVQYIQDAYKKFYFYDVFDKNSREYLPQIAVKELAKEFGFIYVHEYYYGPFISWEHCRSFLNKGSDIAVGDIEGIVCKNQTRINSTYSKLPFVLKIINESFSEVMKNREKVVDPDKVAGMTKAQEIVDMLVTRNRVEKEIFKMRDEGILPEKIEPTDMKTVAKNLPKRIYDDCLKEEREYVIDAGEYFGKTCGATAMKLAKEIILGG